MRARLKKSKTDDTVEPLSVTVTGNNTAIIGMAEKLALIDHSDDLAEYLRRAWKTAKPIRSGAASRTININDKAFSMIDPEALGEMYGRVHHKLTLSGAELKNSPATVKELMNQLSPFLSKVERRNLLQDINAGKTIDIDKEMLPKFAAKMVGKYVIHRGPNCFHAALAFQSPTLTSSSLINVKKEKGYHRAMINYDELWRVINTDFYEVDPDKVSLKYGDMLVFFEVPKNLVEVGTSINFRWIRHAATYLFGGYTFSKGSKSPNTPYTIRTLSEEWNTWKHYTQNLGIKVFRRSQKHVKSQPPMDLADWIY
jgi:hypothetical protein